jgi:hypothetical protein
LADAKISALPAATADTAAEIPVNEGGTTKKVSMTAAGAAIIEDADAATQRTTLGLGTIATQAANNVTISGGSVTGITDLAVADGGTGASTLTGLVKGNGTSAFTAVTAPSGAVVGDTDTQTLSNKRFTARVVTVADATSITPNIDTTDVCYQLNTQAAGTLTINAPTGTPVDGDAFIIKVKCTNAQTLSFNAIYRGGTDIALPTVTTAAKIDRMGFRYDPVGTKWDIVSLARGY